MADIQFRNIRKSYGNVEVLSGIDLDIHDEEFVALIGPSGCGKSTLLRIIAGLEEHKSGDVQSDDVVVNDMTPMQRDIAMVFQSYALYPHMNVAGNMGFTLRMRGEKKAEIQRKVRDAADVLNLSDYLERKPAELSGGQRQRVAMGRALVRNPKVFLFDEPLSNLDAKLRVEMRTEIRRLHQELKATSIYVTHDQVEAMTMADRIVVLNEGRIVQQGRPMDLFDRPASIFVAEFIGSPQINLFDGQVSSGMGGSVLEASAGVSIALPSLVGQEMSAVRWGVRPDDVLLAAGDDAMIQGRVVVVEHTGSETLLFMDTALGRLCIKVPPRSPVLVGEQLGVRFETSSLHLFDASNGLRVDMAAGD